MAQVQAALEAFNGRHPWSHNDHFHGWVLRHLPSARGEALDVGCGEGVLAGLLATCFGRVVAIDRDADMAASAADRLRTHQRVAVRQAAFGEETGSYDLITMVAVLHHLDLVEALRHASLSLNSGGKLLVVGLARMATATDVAYDLVSAVANPLVGVVKHPRALRDATSAPPFPVADPVLTYGEIRRVVQRELPGAHMRRRLFFRFTLEWTKP